MSSLEKQLRIKKRADVAMERAAERLRSTGQLERRDFLRLGAVTLAGTLLSACNSEGPKWADRWLKAAEKNNEKVERWLFSHTSMNQGSPKSFLAGNRFPSYYISSSVPTWDYSKGPWFLNIGGAVRNPVKLDMAGLMKLRPQRQRIDHFCVEGWTAVEILTGAPMSEIARLVQPTSDAHFVDFVSFDDDYHESWDIESALHPQTIVAYAKEDALLPPAYGAPARVHSPVKLGYKNTKYLTYITFMPEKNGGYWSDFGYEWYGGT